MKSPILCMESFTERLYEVESKVRESAQGQIKDWETAEIYPVIGYHPEYLSEPELIGAALVGTPRVSGGSCLSLYSLEDDISDELCEFLDMVMDLGDGLDSACEIMLSYHRAIIPVRGESLGNWQRVFEEVLAGKRSNNHRKLMSWQPVKTEIKVQQVSIQDFLKDLLDEVGTELANKLMNTEFDESFKEEWA